MQGTLNITLQTATVTIEDADDLLPITVIPIQQIVKVTGVYNEGTINNGRFKTKTVLNLHLSDGNVISNELQLVTNQSTWSDGTLEDLNTAITAIRDLFN